MKYSDMVEQSRDLGVISFLNGGGITKRMWRKILLTFFLLISLCGSNGDVTMICHHHSYRTSSSTPLHIEMWYQSHSLSARVLTAHSLWKSPSSYHFYIPLLFVLKSTVCTEQVVRNTWEARWTQRIYNL